MRDSVIWKIGGEAGFGIMSAGTMMARAFARVGYHTMVTNEYPSLIRGGHNLITVRISPKYFESMNREVHILVALHNPCVELHKAELNDNALVVYDPKDREWQASDFPKPVHLLPVPLMELVSTQNGPPVMRNTVALGVTLALVGAEFSIMESIIRDQFKKKKQAVIDSNIAIAKSGYDYVKKHFPDETSMYLSKAEKKEPQLILNASEAVGLGAYRGGLKFAAIYPMTPINSVITFFADHAKQLKIVYKQPEDEISGINMALGASYAGVRSMVASSGGGFALMVEGLSLAGIMEVPIVINLGMRVGPATGMPTWTEQGELQFVIHAGHGEFPRIVLAPSDAAEAFELTAKAFNLADRYQIPVFVLTDKYLAESHWCVGMSHFKKEYSIDRGKMVVESDLPADKSYKRYRLDVDDGVSPRSIPGMKNGVFFSNGYEHDEKGYVTESGSDRIAMANKRLKKFEAMKKDIAAPHVYGDKDADITFVSWGSSRGPVIDAMEMLRAKGKKANLVHFTWLYPFPEDETAKLLSSAKRVIDVEQNSSGQLAALIREHTGFLIAEKILKYDGRPFYPEEIVEGVEKGL
jgi:2-oxoglutarate/2-oxoacid ferredoxin oxidoreductase subunit alpha